MPLLSKLLHSYLPLLFSEKTKDIIGDLCALTFATVHVAGPACPPYSIIWRV